MCGVFAYMGQRNPLENIVSGLQRLEYRGYDSWGVAFPLNQKIEMFKSLESLQEADRSAYDFEVEFALGHTRWATHGAVNLSNCHPHVSLCGNFALVHNGIVENYQQLKSELLANGMLFVSETDSEVIVRLIEWKLQALDAANCPIDNYCLAFRQAFEMLQGHNTLVLICANQQLLLGVRNGSPLIAGLKQQDVFLASDYHSFANHTQQCLLIDDKQMIICQQQQVKLYDLATHQYIPTCWQKLSVDLAEQDKQGYQHFMLKEVCEQWQTVTKASQIDMNTLELLSEVINSAGNVYLTGAGAAFFVAEQIELFLREIAGIRAHAIPAYEYHGYLSQMRKGDLLLAISQSGETADTLRFIQHAKNKQLSIASVVNMPGAMMTRLSDFAFSSNCGSEVCVLSTKTTSAQLVFGYLLAHHLIGKFQAAKRAIESLSYPLSHYFSQDSLQDFSELAERIKGEHLYLLGQGKYLGVSKIGALNIKESSYIHAEAFSAGELKHGVIALIEESTPVICFVDDTNQDYMISIASEVKARGGFIIGICQTPNPIFDYTIVLPAANNRASAVTDVIPCQLLAYFLAVKRGLNPDKPRNLAKSVTVI